MKRKFPHAKPAYGAPAPEINTESTEMGRAQRARRKERSFDSRCSLRMTMLIACSVCGLLEWQRTERNADASHADSGICLCRHQRRRLHCAAERRFRLSA